MADSPFNLCCTFQASIELIEKDKASLWWAGKELLPEKLLQDYVGKNEKTKIVVKLTKVGIQRRERELS